MKGFFNMATTEKISRSQFVRSVLQEIGAISANPPEDWRKQVEEALRKNKMEMHNVTIYQIRKKLLQESGFKGKQRKRRKNAETVALAKPRRTRKEDVSLDDIFALQKFAEKFGGFKRLQHAISVLEQFQV
jgi:hypothetical protein